MTIRNLDAVFKPKSVAIFGASNRTGSLGRILTENLLNQFGGKTFLVNPKYQNLFGREVYSNVNSLPEIPDLAVLVTPPETVPKLISELASKGTRGACVITAGFSEQGEHSGNTLRQAMLDAAKPGLLRIVGPNCLGIQMPGLGLNASFAHTFPKPGSIAFIAQSGAMIAAVLDWAIPRGIGFSHTVSLGDMADVDFGDMLDYLANDPETSAILLYIEAIGHARKFMSAARAAARSKPVIVVKAGRYEAGAKAAASHTGALAGRDDVYDAAFQRAGMLRVISLEELFDAVETLATARMPAGDRLAILTNGGGIGVLAADTLISENGQLATLADKTVERLNQVLPKTWSHGNPVDIVGDAAGQRYTDALKILLEDNNVDGILILNCPTGLTSSDEAAVAIIDALHEKPKKTILTSWVGEHSAREPRNKLRNQGIPTYQSPEDAVKAFTQMVNYRRNQAMLIETPPSLPEHFEPKQTVVKQLIEKVLQEKREWLNEVEAKQALDAYGIPTVQTEFAASPKEAALIASRFEETVAVKLISPDILHKSDKGCVKLDILPENVEPVATEMLQRIQSDQPEARIKGFSIQAMIQRQHAYELIVGMIEDKQFGPVMLFGHGGTAVEVVNDKALALPPLNLKLANDLISRTNIYRLLQGYRNVAPVDMQALKLALVRLSYFITDFSEIRELDINPLLADEKGVVALDARIKVAKVSTDQQDRLAIKPYPKELEEVVPVSEKESLLLRPIVPEDEPALQRAFGRLTKEEIRFRFFIPLKFFDHLMGARFTQIDYDRQMALVLTDAGIPGKTEIYGVVRLIEDPDRERAEFAIVIEHHLAGRGLGTYLIKRMLDYARERGIGEVYGDVLWDNERMLALCRSLGFSTSRDSNYPGVVRVALSL